jgi:hypothetical protein
MKSIGNGDHEVRMPGGRERVGGRGRWGEEEAGQTSVLVLGSLLKVAVNARE